MDAPSPNWQDFLNRLVQALEARGGGIWLVDGPQPRLAATAGVSPTEVLPSEEKRQRRQQLIQDVLTTHRANALDIEASPDDAELGPSSLLMAAIVLENHLLGAVEIVQRAPLPPQQRMGQLQFLQQSCQWHALTTEPANGQPANSTSAAPQLPAPIPEEQAADRLPAKSADWPAAMRCIQHIQRNRRLKDVAEATVNETRLLFNADRVSIGVPSGRRIKIIAVSGQDRVQTRSNLVQAMAKMARLVAATKEPFRFDGETTDIPPSLERPLAMLTQLSGARMVLIVPLLEPRRTGDAEEWNARQKKSRSLQGVLIIEQMRQSQPQPELVAHFDLVREQLATAITHARQYESIFLLPLWTALGRAWSALRGRRLAWTLLIAGLLVGVTTAMFQIPWPYRVEAQGQLMPVVQRDVFAPSDGQVVELLVRGGDRVSSGQLLLNLRNDDLSSELARLRGELGEKRKLVVALLAQIDDAERTAQREEATRLFGKVAEAKVEVEGLTERVAILNDRIDRLTVRAPISGVVTTFQAEQLLFNRPVQRGDVLLQVMDDRGDWQLELDLPEQRLGHLLAAQAHSAPDLPVTFRLLTHPEESHRAKLASVGTRTATSEERGSVVELRAALNSGDIDHPSIGAKVRARIDCGEKPLGYCLFGDVLEFVQKYLWW